MKIRITKNQLKSVITTLFVAGEKDYNEPFVTLKTSGNQAVFTFTNTIGTMLREISVDNQVTGEVEVEGEGEGEPFFIDKVQFTSVAKLVKNNIKFVLSDDKTFINVTIDDIQKITLYNEKEPSIAKQLLADDYATGEVRIEAKHLQRALEITVNCVSKDTSRQYLNGVCFDAKTNGALNLVSTNGVMLAYTQVLNFNTFTADFSAIIPTVCVKNLLQALKLVGKDEIVKISCFFNETDEPAKLQATKVRFNIAHITVTCRCTDAIYPAYAKVFPDEKALINSIPHGTKQLLKKMQLSLLEQQKVKQPLYSINVNNEKEEQKTTFYIDDFMKLVKYINKTQPRLYVHTTCNYDKQPAKITFADENSCFLIMPYVKPDNLS